MKYVKIRISDGEIVKQANRHSAPDSVIKGYAWLPWKAGTRPDFDPRTHTLSAGVTLPDLEASLAGKFAVETFTVSARSSAEINATLIADCKQIAYDKIIAIPFPEYLQRNLAGAGVRALKKVVVDEEALTSEEMTKFAAGEALLARVDAIRSFSDALETSIIAADISAKVSTFDNAEWPE